MIIESPLFREQRQPYRDHLREKLVESQVPEHLHDGLVEYIVIRRPTGHFLKAVLSNDLREACGRADFESRTALYEIVFFLHNYATSTCWGSPAAVEAWLAEETEPPMVIE